MPSNEHSMSAPERQKIEPLPPTPISEQARKKLEQWGLNPEEIARLQEFTAQFRYDLCEQKLRRIAETPVEVYTQDGHNYVNVPNFHDLEEGRLEGNCAQIAQQFIRKINEDGLIKDWELKTPHSHKIRVNLHEGLSKTHFCTEERNHVWNSLSLLDQNENKIVEEVMIDAAFQNILTPEEAGYRSDNSYRNVIAFKIEENEYFKFYSRDVADKDDWGADIPTRTVLGMSKHFKYAYALGFLRDKKTERVGPAIERIDAEGRSQYYHLQGQYLLYSTGENPTDEEEKEIRKLLDIAKQIKFVEQPPTQKLFHWTRK